MLDYSDNHTIKITKTAVALVLLSFVFCLSASARSTESISISESMTTCKGIKYFFEKLVLTDRINNTHCASNCKWVVLFYNAQSTNCSTKYYRTQRFQIQTSDGTKYSPDSDGNSALRCDFFRSKDTKVELVDTQLHPGVNKKLAAVFQIPIEKLKGKSRLLLYGESIFLMNKPGGPAKAAWETATPVRRPPIEPKQFTKVPSVPIPSIYGINEKRHYNRTDSSYTRIVSNRDNYMYSLPLQFFSSREKFEAPSGQLETRFGNFDKTITVESWMESIEFGVQSFEIIKQNMNANPLWKLQKRNYYDDGFYIIAKVRDKIIFQKTIKRLNTAVNLRISVVSQKQEKYNKLIKKIMQSFSVLPENHVKEKGPGKIEHTRNRTRVKRHF